MNKLTELKKIFQTILGFILLIIFPLYLIMWHYDVITTIIPGSGAVIFNLAFALALSLFLVPPFLLVGSGLSILLGIESSKKGVKVFYFLLAIVLFLSCINAFTNFSA